jgi:hypothetical protein
MQPGESQSTFQRNILPPSSVSKVKKSAEAGRKQSPLHACFLFDLLFNPEDGDMLL